MQDIQALIDTDEYRGQPGVNASDMGSGFTVPADMIVKMKALMVSLREKSGAAADTSMENDFASELTNDCSKPESSMEGSVPRPESGLANSLDDLELHSQEMSSGAIDVSIPSPYTSLPALSPLAPSDLSVNHNSS